MVQNQLSSCFNCYNDVYATFKGLLCHFQNQFTVINIEYVGKYEYMYKNYIINIYNRISIDNLCNIEHCSDVLLIIFPLFLFPTLLQSHRLDFDKNSVNGIMLFRSTHLVLETFGRFLHLQFEYIKKPKQQILNT